MSYDAASCYGASQHPHQGAIVSREFGNGDVDAKLTECSLGYCDPVEGATFATGHSASSPELFLPLTLTQTLVRMQADLTRRSPGAVPRWRSAGRAPAP